MDHRHSRADRDALGALLPTLAALDAQGRPRIVVEDACSVKAWCHQLYCPREASGLSYIRTWFAPGRTAPPPPPSACRPLKHRTTRNASGRCRWRPTRFRQSAGALPAPLAEERGLAEPRRRTDQQRPMLHAAIELAPQPRPRNQAEPGRRDVQFRVDVRERER